jgi:thiol-disulfide isomerase/thioredoxin
MRSCPFWHGLILIAAIGLFATGCVPTPAEQTDLTVSADAGAVDGANVPDAKEVTLRVVNRQQYDEVIASHKGKVVLVDFWATWCGPCVEEFPRTVMLADKYAEAGLAAVSVSVDEAADQEKALAFLKEQNATFDNLISEYGFGNEHAATVFGTDGQVPHYKLYDRTGKLRFVFANNIDESVGESPDNIEIRVKELLEEGQGAESQKQESRVE